MDFSAETSQCQLCSSRFRAQSATAAGGAGTLQLLAPDNEKLHDAVARLVSNGF